jgi:hypothetical protein
MAEAASGGPLMVLLHGHGQHHGARYRQRRSGANGEPAAPRLQLEQEDERDSLVRKGRDGSV